MQLARGVTPHDEDLVGFTFFFFFEGGSVDSQVKQQL